MQQQKRLQERTYLQKMLQENEENKKKAEAEKLQQKAADVHAQEEYVRMLDKQEQDRQREFIAREKRAQDYMNRMAGDVIKNQATRQKAEDDALTRYEMEREMRLREEDRARQERERREKVEMAELLKR